MSPLSKENDSDSVVSEDPTANLQRNLDAIKAPSTVVKEFTTRSGKHFTVFKEKHINKDGTIVTKAVTRKDNGEQVSSIQTFPLPDNYEVDSAYLPEQETYGKIEILGVIEMTESDSVAAAKILVKYEDGSTADLNVRLISKENTNPVDNQGTIQTDESETESVNQQIEEARQEVNTNPSEAQKEAGNYKMGHISLDGLDISLENPKGSVRRGRDKSGKEWETTMHYDYGYIRSTMGVDGDHIDVFLSDNPSQGNVYVVDQVDPETGKFDEHKVMYGFNSVDEARAAYLSNYEEGWQGLGNITPVSKEEFRSWLQSSTKKTKPFAEYASVKPLVEKPQTLNEIPDEWMDSKLQGRDAEVVSSIDEISDKDFKEYGRSVIVPNIPENILAAIGAKDKNVLLKRGVFAKNDISHKFTPEQSRAILSAALYAPNLVGPSQKITRPDYRVVIKTGVERNPIVVLDVSNTKDNLEIVSWFSLDGRNLDRIKRQAIREGGELLILSPGSVPAASLSALPDAVLFESKYR